MEALISFTFTLTLFTLLHNHIVPSLAQFSPAPTPSGPTNITAILEKAGQFSILVRLMKATQVADQVNTQLNNSNQGLTIFAPPDNAFQALKAGTLNVLSDQEKVSLVQFHVLPTFLSVSQFQTVSNPVRTQAGNSNNGLYPLNVTTSGNGQVNISTGVDDATLTNTIYTDGQLAVYQVNKVLLPLDLFVSPAPAPAPAPAPSSDQPNKKAKKPSLPAANSPTTNDKSRDTSEVTEVAAALTYLTAALVGIWLNL